MDIVLYGREVRNRHAEDIVEHNYFLVARHTPKSKRNCFHPHMAPCLIGLKGTLVLRRWTSYSGSSSPSVELAVPRALLVAPAKRWAFVLSNRERPDTAASNKKALDEAK